VTAAAERIAGALERYEAVIGIEIHCQLRTVSKMFCGCSNAYADAAPNTHLPVCSVPGARDQPPGRRACSPRASRSAPRSSAQVGRKNCICGPAQGCRSASTRSPWPDGRLAIEASEGPFVVDIRRAHLEEDTAKLIHGDAAGADGRRASLVDFNRSGAPLMEIVTEPGIRTAEQARRYAEELQLLLRAIGASDADMERGQMRVEANVSLRPRGTEAFGTRVEVKNMNSFRAVERAINFEIERQARARRR
jgi:aspartyl-tRNA(Asn)/glutamyl-tRNA(Gln) amidotransferase subunit B